MATQLEYLEAFDVISGEAKVMVIHKTEDDRVDIVLDKTCYYPRGGGQDWDTGEIASDVVVFNVEEVRLDQEGVVHHIGVYKSGELVVGESVTCKVDAERRIVNTKLHSAGHLIDMAVTELDLPWAAGKGAHYPHMSFVEYNNGSVTHEEAVVRSIKDKLAELQQSTYENKILFVPVSEMSKYCRHVPDNIPTNKPSRIVLYADDFGIPCGGTHVKKVSNIGEIVITKVKSKGGVTKISYAVAGINA